MNKLIITNLLSVTIAVAGTLLAIGCANDAAKTPNPTTSIENAPFNKVKVYIPKTEEDLQLIEEAFETNAILSVFSKEQLTAQYTDFSHSYQLIEDNNEELQLEEVQLSLEETWEANPKQNLTLEKVEEELNFKSQIEGKDDQLCPLGNAYATDNRLATRYLLCHGNLLVIEKEVTQDDEAGDDEAGNDEAGDDEAGDDEAGEAPSAA